VETVLIIFFVTIKKVSTYQISCSIPK